MYWFSQPCQQYFLISMVCKYFHTLYFKLFCSTDLWCACHAMMFYQCSAFAALAPAVFSAFLTSVQQFNSQWTTIQVARCYQHIFVEFALKIMCLARWHIWLCIRCIQTISSTQQIAQNQFDEDHLLLSQFFSIEEAAQLSIGDTSLPLRSVWERSKHEEIFFPSSSLSSICSGISVLGG